MSGLASVLSPDARKKVSRIERQYKAVIFDWKGTIAVKRKKHHKRKKWSAIFQAAKHDNPKDGREWSAVQVMAAEIAKETVFTDLESKLLEAEKEYATARKAAQKPYTTINFLRWFLEEKVGIASEEKRDAIVDAYMEEFLHIKWFQDPPELYPGAVEVLRRLKKEGVKTALLRNCSLHAKGQRKILAHHGLDDLFDVIVSAGELDTEGPSDLGYREVITKLGMEELHTVHPEQILFVGDRTEQDVVGGNKMGWKTCLLTTSEPTSHGLATFEVDSWVQLANEVIWPRKFIKKTDGDAKPMQQSFEDTLKPITEQNLGINPFIQAVAGHRWQEGKQGFLRGGDRVYKPLPSDGEKGMREADFYQVVQHLGPQHFPFVPRCYGVRNFVVNTAVPEVSPDRVEVRTKVLPHLVLEDVTAPYDEPSVLDVKIGLITYDPNTTDLEKIASQKKKYPHQAEMGYSVAGMRVYNVVTKSYETRNRQWGRALRRHEAHLVFETFFWNGAAFDMQAAKDALVELERVREWMLRQTSHRFYSSSLLFVYEGDNEVDTPTIRRQLDESETDESHSDVTVRMIDFPTVVATPDGGQALDTNYLEGLALLMGDLRHFIEKHDMKK